MKKLMTLMLGMSLVFGIATLTFAQDKKDDKKEGQKSGKKKGSKKKEGEGEKKGGL